MVSQKEQELEKKVNTIWGKKCKDCGYAGNLTINFEKEKNYLICIAECPKCGLLLFVGEDGKYRWLIRE